MTTFSTGNPLPSTEVRDLFDNAENLDNLVNGQNLEYPDRLGVGRKSWAGMEQDFIAFLAASGFEPTVLVYMDGSPLQVDRPTQLIERAATPGILYSIKLPSSFPVILSGTFATDEPLLVIRVDSSLRADLASQVDAAKGAGLVGFDPSLAYPANTVGAALAGSLAMSVASIVGLLTAPTIENRATVVHGYFAGEDTGGGTFAWDPAEPKASHDGRDFISPTVPWDGLAATLGNFLAGVGESNPGGNGCWVRMIESHEIEVDSYGNITAGTLNHAIAELDTGDAVYTGGQLAIPTGQHAVNATITIDNSSVFDIQGVTVKGRGKQASTLNFSTQPAAQNGVEFMTPIFAGMEDMGVRDSTRSGVKLVGQPTIPGAVSWNHFNMDRCRLSFNDLNGLEADRGFMGHFNQVFASHNSANGFRFDGLHTSLHFDNCYAASNTQSGYSLVEPTYSVMSACAADTNGIYGYLITKAAATVLNGCGSESNGRAGFAALSSTALGQNYPILLNGFFAFNNNTANAGFPNAIYMQAQNSIPNTVIARGCRSFSPAFATLDASVDGIGAYLIDEYNDFPNGVGSVNGGYIHHVPKTAVVRSLTVSAPTDVIELQNTQGAQTSFTGELLVTASNQQPSNTRAGNIATYKLLVIKHSAGVGVTTIASIGLVSGASAADPSFTWSISGNFLRATPVGSTSGVFFFEVLSQGGVKVKQ